MTQADNLDVARELIKTCVSMYRGAAAGLSPEVSVVGPDGAKPSSSGTDGLLRPETAESLFILHRVTGDPRYLEEGWEIFLAIEKSAKLSRAGLPAGYTAVGDVRKAKPPKLDRIDSFFYSETLKYLYLLFSPSTLLPLDEWVLNTEGHPFPIDST